MSAYCRKSSCVRITSVHSVAYINRHRSHCSSICLKIDTVDAFEELSLPTACNVKSIHSMPNHYMPQPANRETCSPFVDNLATSFEILLSPCVSARLWIYCAISVLTCPMNLSNPHNSGSTKSEWFSDQIRALIKPFGVCALLTCLGLILNTVHALPVRETICPLLIRLAHACLKSIGDVTFSADACR